MKWSLEVLKTEKKHIEKVKCLFLLPRAIIISHEIVSKKFDVVHLFWGHYPSLIGLILKSKNPSIHLSMFLGAYDLVKNLAISKKCASECDTLWTHANANKNTLAKQGYDADGFKVVYRGLPVADLNQKYPIIPEVRNIDFVYVGRLIKEKGLNKLVATLAILKLKYPHFSCEIAGDGPLRSKLQKYIEDNDLNDNCRLLGFLNQDEVFNLLLRSKNFIMLSVKEGECIPNALKEAIWSGCYCLVTPFHGYDEIIMDSSRGKIITDMSIENIAMHLEKRLNANDLPNLEQSRKLILSKFNTEKAAKVYIQGWANVRERS